MVISSLSVHLKYSYIISESVGGLSFCCVCCVGCEGCCCLDSSCLFHGKSSFCFCFVFILTTVYQVEVDSLFTNLFVFENSFLICLCLSFTVTKVYQTEVDSLFTDFEVF